MTEDPATLKDEVWHVRLKSVDDTLVPELSEDLLNDLAVAFPDATFERNQKRSEDGTRSIADTDFGLIMIALSPFFAEQLLLQIEHWTTRKASTSPLERAIRAGAHVDSKTKVDVSLGGLKVSVSRSSKTLR